MIKSNRKHVVKLLLIGVVVLVGGWGALQVGKALGLVATFRVVAEPAE